MRFRFVRFLKALLAIAAVLNLLFLFVFNYKVPSEIRLPSDQPELSGEAAASVGESAGEKTETEEAKPTKEPTKAPIAESEREPAKVVREEPEEPAVEEPVRRCIIINTDGSNIRSGPGLDYEVITVYAYNTILKIIGETEDGWYPIRAEDGTTGYVFETQINILEEENQTNETQGQEDD